MATVGVRELRQRASELLRRVEAGETIEVTDRGRPVAVLAPLPEAGVLEKLRAAGEVTPAAGSLSDLPLPLPVPNGKESPSAILARLRRNER
ncbi:MAG: type II toxin-antitoxin system prevent-host-death family antitoxin [Chloroflexi bacterium]|nr:MAG: type II toxin-antitoxin system prevent-host-death family antitoxin [Chloroflexota bacterium]